MKVDRKQVRYTTPAKGDLAQLMAYLRQESSQAALLVLERIEATCDNPFLGREVEGEGLVAGTRRVNIRDTQIFLVYLVEPASIEILRVMHGSRNWPWEHPSY